MSDIRGIRQFALAFAVFCLAANFALAEQFVLIGKVVDLDSGAPIPGASVRSSNSLRGTYTSVKGVFRLPVIEGSNEFVKISSLGYETNRLEISKRSTDTIIVKMKPVAIRTGQVEVNAMLSPEQIVARAIKQKSANVSKIKTFSGLLYSKVVMKFDGKGIDNIGLASGSVSVGASSEEKAENEAFKQFVLETYSRQSRDFEKGIVHTTILRRRQTANIEPDNNLLTLGNFESFYNDRIKIVDAELPSPLASDALSFYNYELASRSMIDDRYVYILKTEPKNKRYPGFIGTIAIIEGSYNLIELHLRPSESTAPSFLDSVSYEQKFEEIARDVWYPTFLEVHGVGGAKVLQGVLEIRARIKATSIFSEVEVNGALPDSIYKRDLPRVTISHTADSLSGQFWSENSLREITPEELAIYERIDSLMQGKKAIKAEGADEGFSFSPGPFIDFNRVTSVSIGPTIDVSFWDFVSNSRAYYSFGTKKLHGTAALEHNLLFYEDFALDAEVSAYSEATAFGGDNQYSRIMNTINSALFHSDYFDYFLAEGFRGSLIADFRKLSFEFSYDERNESSLKKTTNNSIFSKENWRKNPLCESGRYRVAGFTMEYGLLEELQLVDRFEAEVYVDVRHGQKIGGVDFNALEFYCEFGIPTFETGYNPMALAIGFRSGWASNETPVQYQFRMPSNKLFLTVTDFFVTAPQGEYGGNQYLETHFQYNLTDLWQRSLGLLLWNGRGLDLTVGGAIGAYINDTDSFYKGNPKLPFAEAGFGFGRIPTFVSNIFFLNVNFRWGVSRINRGRWGADISLFTPF